MSTMVATQRGVGSAGRASTKNRVATAAVSSGRGSVERRDAPRIAAGLRWPAVLKGVGRDDDGALVRTNTAVSD